MQELTTDHIQSLFKPRDKFSHKGTYGHALLVAGSYGKMGAAILAASACLRSGVGLLTTYIPRCGYDSMQISNPEAMVITGDEEKIISGEMETDKFSAVGIGPGIGTGKATQHAIYQIITQSKKPLVLDADALNILSLNKEWLPYLPTHSILTPHPKEFERIAGTSNNDDERHALQISFSKTHHVFVILKGANTHITTPSGETYINTTGNPGMATGGSGDVLTGILTSLLAQGYEPLQVCQAGVFIHGLAGDLAAKELGAISMIAGDICAYLPQAFKLITG